ncbi:unnamed protein product [Acanthoscelides obtectus]|uniref:MRN complex-interacting protein N-terminal domain-containing protein n=1 Tax=Acanthoscelides obtectus TaxID=200917 RepID=A0A9P0MKF5_ACAOB|nr:unnamed protein product [Acanthoscelides obtectus]CAK1629815.1 MRN complex-interacting protein [Acanthoscelides obtectus]
MQEFIVLQCFNCKVYQVHIVKKSSKWRCKLCNAKQSIVKIFMKSESAKECRVIAQELNEKYIKHAEELAIALWSETKNTPIEEPGTKGTNSDNQGGILK